MRNFLRWVQPALLAASAIFIGALLVRQWPELRALEWHLSAGWLAASAGFMLAAWAVEISLWRGILRALGGAIDWIPAARIWFLSAVVRYVPGNIWQPLSIALQAQEHAVRAESSLTSVALYQGISLLAAAPIAAAYFWATGNWGLLTGAIGGVSTPLILLALLPVALFLLRPDLLTRAFDWLLGKAGRPALGATLSRGALLLFIVIGIMDWILWGATFAALTFGIQAFSAAEIAAFAPHLVFSYAIAYAVGFLSFITPSGFGVREGALWVLLAPLLGASTATVAALAMRLWNMLGEVVMALISVAFRRPSMAGLRTEEEPG